MQTKSTGNRFAQAMTAVDWPMAWMLSLVINSTSRTFKRAGDPARWRFALLRGDWPGGRKTP